MDKKRIHFLDKNKSRWSLLCRLMGHEYMAGNAKTDDGDVVDFPVCKRCYEPKWDDWEGIKEWRRK